MHALIDDDKVFAILGNPGTPTAAVAVPIASAKHIPFFGAFTGAGLLRKTPLDRYELSKTRHQLSNGDDRVFARQPNRARRDRGGQQRRWISVDTSHVARGHCDRVSAGVDDRFHLPDEDASGSSIAM